MGNKYFTKICFILFLFTSIIGCNNLPPEVQQKVAKINKENDRVYALDLEYAFGGYSITDSQELIREYTSLLNDYREYSKWRRKNYGIEEEDLKWISGIESRILELEEEIAKERVSIKEGNERYRNEKFTCRVCGREIGRAGSKLAGGLCLQCNSYKREDERRGNPWKE